MPKRYKAIEVLQQPEAPPMYLISVSAAELLEWCDVPRTKENYMAGYQRLLDEGRSTAIGEYLEESPHNVLPGAIIVAADGEYVRVEKDEDDAWLIVTDDERDLETKRLELFGQFTTRLSPEELASADISVIGTDEGGENGDEEIEVEDSEYPSSYLARLANELQMVIDEKDVSPERIDAINAYIEGISKPGLIIDGQHRVIGAKNVSAHDVQLPVVVMYALPHEEQVFQFYVLNKKAKPLGATELRRIISTSLTNEEIDNLQRRFKTSGIDTEEARWSYEMNHSPKSPFRGLIDFGLGSNGVVIPESVADQLVRKFMKMQRKRFSKLMDPVKERWDDPESRLGIFFDFWSAVKEAYADVWEDALEMAEKDQTQHQIFRKVSLLTLQQFLLDRFVTALPYRGKDANPPFYDAETTREMVLQTLENLPSKFFKEKWMIKQMDTSEGRALFYETMSQAWDNQGKNIGNMTLFKKPKLVDPDNPAN